MTDKIKPELLQWIYDRLRDVHGESESFDYMRAFKEQMSIATEMCVKNERLERCLEVTDKSWREMVCEIENITAENERLKTELNSALARERELQRELCTRIARNTWNAYHDGPMQSPLEIAKTRGWNCYDTESDTK